MNGKDRPRGPPLGPPPRRGDLPPGNPGSSSQSRGDAFEDEKRRIIHSCFAKKDEEGQQLESYITHVRITEDSVHPSSPAPPDGPPENKKPRIIIISVRKSGRVRVHKARENADGSFSIGKTWMLDDLSAIQSFASFVPKTPVEQQQKEWASNIGFTVTIGKPYYWHARTAKERDFFIGSLVKVYRKYTNGKVPNLIGFDDREREMLARHGQPDSGVPTSLQPSYRGPDASRDGLRDKKRTPEDPALRNQKSREQMSRPSTGSRPSTSQGRPAPSPFDLQKSAAPGPAGAPENHQPPPRAAERMAASMKTANSAPEPRAAEPGSYSGIPESLRPSSGRSQDRGAKSSAPATQPVLNKAPEALRPSTATSFHKDTPDAAQRPTPSFGPKSPQRDGGESVSSNQPTLPQDRSAPSSLSAGGPGQTREPSSSPAPVMEGLASEPAAMMAANMDVEEPDRPVPEKAPTETAPVEDSQSEPTSMQAEETADSAAHRPGLGPMVKKKDAKDIAGAWRKAANAYGAFKPRAGGAGERLLAAAKKQQAATTGPDGITSVVPAPSLTRSNTDPPHSPLRSEQDLQLSASAAPAAPDAGPGAPTVEVTEPAVEETAPAPVESPQISRENLSDVVVKVEDRSRTPSPAAQGRRRRRREDHTVKYCQALGIDPRLLDGRGLDFDDILSDLGWNGRLADEQKIEDLEADIRREIGRVEATSWLGNLEQQEGKVEQLASLIDKTIEECDELEGLLTLYSHELNTLHEDVAYIEAQGQGLQVQTANQKLLQNELQTLLKTLTISSAELGPLKEASLNSPEGLKETESALSTLYKAMLTIDSDIGQNKRRQVDASVGVYADTEIGQMRAIKQKKEEYRSLAITFLHRLRQFMAVAFKQAEQKRAESTTGVKDPMKLDSAARGHFRQEIWQYNPLMLFAKEVSMAEWHSLVGLYEQQSKPSYQNDFRDNNLAWKKTARKPTGDEQELLFTHQEKEKEAEGITMAARKLTVRRGKTVRAAAGSRLASGGKKEGRTEPSEAFAGTLRETLNMVAQEQNFIVQFFHLDSLASADFSDLVSSTIPDNRSYPEVSANQSHDPDRAMAKRVEQIMDEIYSFWPNDMQSLVDWAMQADPLQGIGILHSLETAMNEFDDTNQEFILHTLQKIHSRLMGLFNRFVDEQIRGIEDTKVKVNKRKGVISFMRVFPQFSNAVESLLSSPSDSVCDIRISVNEAYDRINRAMWESLKFIAKEAPGQPPGVAASAGDPEDKEILNYHILLIENMNHYIEEVDVHNIPALERWVDRAHQDFQEHMKLYVDAVIHRPLGKLIDFVQSIDNLLAAGGNPTGIASRASHSRIVAKKVLSSYDNKEIRRGIEMLKKRVEKHFGDADDPGLSRSLVVKVLRECENRYEDVYDRTRRIIDDVYEGQLDLDWRKEETLSMFRK
ncbi:hypothetical protein N7535_005851 [Penicillium sp. DV-2018c]|nr:hypothetical protein N7535_005851 [Penicillium sp. DV-2018c]